MLFMSDFQLSASWNIPNFGDMVLYIHLTVSNNSYTGNSTLWVEVYSIQRLT